MAKATKRTVRMFFDLWALTLKHLFLIVTLKYGHPDNKIFNKYVYYKYF